MRNILKLFGKYKSELYGEGERKPLSHEPVSKDLDVAANDFAFKRFAEDKMAIQRRCTRIGFKTGAEWMKEQMINKACEWLGKESDVYIGYYDKQGLIDNFKKAMEAEK